MNTKMNKFFYVLSFPVKLIPVIVIGVVALLLGVRYDDVKEQAVRFLT